MPLAARGLATDTACSPVCLGRIDKLKSDVGSGIPIVFPSYSNQGASMSQNPYSPPQSAGQYLPSDQNQAGPPREFLREVATYQRFVLFSLLANIVINPVLMLGGGLDFFVILALLAMALIIIVLTMVSMFLLTNRIFNVGVAIVCAILMLIPCISLITMLIVNQKATTILQASGIKVGLLGANPNAI